MALTVSSSGRLRRSSPRISAPMWRLSGTTSNLGLVNTSMAGSPEGIGIPLPPEYRMASRPRNHVEAHLSPLWERSNRAAVWVRGLNSSPPDHVCRLFRHHQDGRVDMGRDQVRHRRRVDDAQPFH